jgi:hypothetical protein
MGVGYKWIQSGLCIVWMNWPMKRPQKLVVGLKGMGGKSPPKQWKEVPSGYLTQPWKMAQL